jgi:hypothetical protein
LELLCNSDDLFDAGARPVHPQLDVLQFRLSIRATQSLDWKVIVIPLSINERQSHVHVHVSSSSWLFRAFSGTRHSARSSGDTEMALTLVFRRERAGRCGVCDGRFHLHRFFPAMNVTLPSQLKYA